MPAGGTETREHLSPETTGGLPVPREVTDRWTGDHGVEEPLQTGFALFKTLVTPLTTFPANQQFTECGWPGVKVKGGAQPPSVSFFREYRPFVNAAAVTVPEAGTPLPFTASPIKRPAAQSCEA